MLADGVDETGPSVVCFVLLGKQTRTETKVIFASRRQRKEHKACFVVVLSSLNASSRERSDVRVSEALNGVEDGAFSARPCLGP